MSFSKLIPSYKKPCKNKYYSKFMREDSEMELKVSKEKFDESVVKIGDELRSSIFPSDSDAHFKWQIHFYSLGKEKEGSGYSSVYLHLTWKKIQIPVTAAMCFEMKTDKNESVRKEELEYTYKIYEGYGFPKFYVTDKMKTFSADYFVISAKVCAYYEANSCYTCNFSSERKLLHNHSSLFESGAFSDLIICAKEDKTEFKVHRGILASRSKIFAAMLCNDMQEKQTGRVEVCDLSSFTIKSILNFIYSCEVKFENVQNTLDLLDASEKYDLEDLKLQCAEYLTGNVDETNVSIILINAHPYNLSDLKATSLKYICENKDKFSDKKQLKIIQEKNSDLLLDLITEFWEYVEVNKSES